jgi:hypothetical protein
MLNLFIVIATGVTNQSSTLNSWQAGDFLGSTSQTNTVFTTSGATFQLTGVQFNTGVFNQPFEKRLIQQELADCQRYYAKTFPQGTAVQQAAGLAGALHSQPYGATAGDLFTQWRFPVSMRASPTITTYNSNASNANWRDFSGGSDIVVSVDPDSAKSADSVPICAQTTALTAGHRCYIHASASARM